MTKQDKSDLIWAMKKALLHETLKLDNLIIREDVQNFILNEATSSQLMNLCFNKNHDVINIDSQVLENYARKYILELSNIQEIALLEGSYIEESKSPIIISGGVLAAGAGGWYIYKKLRKAGKSKAEASRLTALAMRKIKKGKTIQ